jgi:hypothetical protein
VSLVVPWFSLGFPYNIRGDCLQVKNLLAQSLVGLRPRSAVVFGHFGGCNVKVDDRVHC